MTEKINKQTKREERGNGKVLVKKRNTEGER